MMSFSGTHVSTRNIYKYIKSSQYLSQDLKFPAFLCNSKVLLMCCTILFSLSKHKTCLCSKNAIQGGCTLTMTVLIITAQWFWFDITSTMHFVTIKCKTWEGSYLKYLNSSTVSGSGGLRFNYQRLLIRTLT